MDTVTLQLFVAVARLGSFAAAARSQNLDPSAVSRAVAALEGEIGVRLLQRTTRRLSLTEAGNVYLDSIAPLLDELAHAGEEALSVSKGVSGCLRMTASVAFGYQRLAPLLTEFRARHPQFKLELFLTDTNLHLVNDRIDLAVRMGAPAESEAVCTKLMATRYRVCASPSYVQKHGAPRQPKDLAAHACLLLTLPEFRHQWRFRDRKGVALTVNVTGDMVVSNPLVQLRCARDGMGPALLADWLAAEALADGTLVDLFAHHEVTATSFDTGIWLLYPSRSYLPRKVRTMVDFLREKMAAGTAAPA